jgi:ribonuclease T2
MKKSILTFLFIALPLITMAKEPLTYGTASLECPAYNNMKHTTNTSNIQLEVGKQYRILQKNDGQILTLIEGASIPQRWVREVCFSDTKNEEKKSITSASKVTTAPQNLLAISWQNAFCQTHQYKKECKNMSSRDFGASNFVLHGLWPQPRNNQYCNVSKKEIGMDKNKQWNQLSTLDLNTTVRNELSKLMPGYASNLHLHEWVKHGTCYGTSANEYYAHAMNLLKQVNESSVQTYFINNIGKTVNLKDIRNVFSEAFGKKSGEHITMNCDHGLITELWLHIGSGEANLDVLLPKGETPKSRCYQGRIDAVGY